MTAALRGGQRGGFAVGLIVGLLAGLALALAVALYVTKAPIPFIDKVPQRTAAQDSAEAERNKNWDPNAGLTGRPGVTAPAAPGSASAPAAPPPVAPGFAAPAPGRDPAAILSGAPVPPPTPSTGAAPEAFIYFVQAGAFTRADDAEQQRARLLLLGLEARISEREQAGRTVWRVRVGPFPAREAADALLQRLQDGGIEAQIVRVEKP